MNQSSEHDAAPQAGDGPAHLPVEAAVVERIEPVPELLQRLHATGELGTQLALEHRLRCVSFLTDEGYSAAEIAGMLCVHERTIVRDRAVLRDADAIEPDLRRIDQLMGEYEHQLRLSVQRLRRISGDSTASPYARLWATETAMRIFERYIDRLHALGYCTSGTARLKFLESMDAENDRRHRAVQKKMWRAARRGPADLENDPELADDKPAPPPAPTDPLPTADELIRFLRECKRYENDPAGWNKFATENARLMKRLEVQQREKK